MTVESGTTKLTNIVLPSHSSTSRFDVEISTGNSKILSVRPHIPNSNPDTSPQLQSDPDFLDNKHDRGNNVQDKHKSPSSPLFLLLPSLCHPHVHLDKPFLLTEHNDLSDPSLPSYKDLTPVEGTFTEALTLTSKSKSLYTPADLDLRGSQLIAESIQYGVGSLRAFVEIDSTVGMTCIDAGVRLKQRFEGARKCRVQLCLFAQDPIFSIKGSNTNKDTDTIGDSEGGTSDINRNLILQTLDRYRDTATIEVLGTTPYVESSVALQIRNIGWAIDTALEYNLHLDFHLDYNLDSSSQPMIWEVLRYLREKEWTRKNPGLWKDGKVKHVMIGHCTRMTLFNKKETERLSCEIREGDLPVSFCGLPTSDLFMMGRPDPSSSSDSSNGESGMSRPRGTMQLLQMKQEYNLDVCMGINNVGNAFTPWGNLDPLRLASLGVGVHQAGTSRGAEELFHMVSEGARKACGMDVHEFGKSSSIGQEELKKPGSENKEGHDRKVVIDAGDGADSDIKVGSRGPWLLIQNEADIKVDGLEAIPARQRTSIADCVWDPPEMRLRRVVGSVPI